MFKRIKQEGLKDCGPSCLLNIIKHYKGNIDINDLKELCKTDKSGTTAYHLIEASKKLGFESYGIKCSLSEFKEDNIILPCIAHVIINNSYSHYIVIEKINFKKKKILIYDPIGKTSYFSYEEFEKIYNNILIILYPIKKIINTPNNSFIQFILNITKSSTNQLVHVIIISIFITLFSIITSFYMQYMIDNIYSKNKVILIFVIFLIIYFLKIISDFLRNKLLILINQKVDFNITCETFKHIINLPYRYYKNNTTGEIISKINDLEAVRQVISKVALSIFIDLPLTILSLIIMYILSEKLFFISVIIMLLYLLIIILFKNKFNNLIDEATLNKANVTSYMVEAINGYETIKGCNMENKIINNFLDKYAIYSNKMSQLDNYYNYQYLLKELINNIGFIVIILAGIMLVIDNKLTIGTLLSFNALLIYFLQPIRNIIDLDSLLKQAKISVKKILYLYYKISNNNYININDFSIEFKNLTFSFDDNYNVLNNINLKIEKGSKVMVIGSSGSGKSTLFKILKQQHEIKRDMVYVDGIDINDYKLNNIVYVSQNEILFTDTIENNIGNDIYNIAKICMIDEITKKLDLGYKTLVEENGFNLSGGEKQRIILGRALANNFDILIIDEGLSQVDTNMERKILKNIIEKYENKTIIFISHRLDNMDLFNQVIKLEKGNLVDDLSKNI